MMYWSEEKDRHAPYVVPDDVVDLAFTIDCPRLPLEHAQDLSSELFRVLPWLESEQRAGVHLIHGAESGNGWFRPDADAAGLLHLSRRARMRLRLPKQRLGDARLLTGETLDIGGFPLKVGDSKVHLLSTLPTQFARYVIADEDEEEERFLQRVCGALRALDIECRKILCGRTHVLSMSAGPVFTRSVMVADLEPEQAVRVQQEGIGRGRKIGCGIFVPHKGIKAVKEIEQ
jgi:CRISPR-associated protein Cas6